MVAPLFDGEYGIGPGHTPVVARIGAGELRITAADGVKSAYYIEGGFVEVSGEVISILTDRILPNEKVSLEVAESQLQAAKALPHSNAELAALRDKAVLNARRMLAAAQKWNRK